MTSLFSNRTIVLATMHGKEQVLAPLLTDAFQATCLVPDGLDTDQFGTFTLDIKRAGDMVHTARAKIDKALEITGYDIGVASEGSFGAHPGIPFIQSNFELTILYDRKSNIELRGHYRTGDTNLDGKHVSSVDEAIVFAQEHGFPEHGVIVRRRKEGKRGIDKNIGNEEDLIISVERFLKRPFTSQVYIETDMRAHRNPTRMQAIQGSIEDLIHNATCLCPSCTMPGFVIKEVKGKLLCGGCAQPTDIPTHEIKRCDACGYQEDSEITKYGRYADPDRCGYCNP